MKWWAAAYGVNWVKASPADVMCRNIAGKSHHLSDVLCFDKRIKENFEHIVRALVVAGLVFPLDYLNSVALPWKGEDPELSTNFYTTRFG